MINPWSTLGYCACQPLSNAASGSHVLEHYAFTDTSLAVTPSGTSGCYNRNTSGVFDSVPQLRSTFPVLHIPSVVIQVPSGTGPELFVRGLHN